jgi:hypothetical protein
MAAPKKPRGTAPAFTSMADTALIAVSPGLNGNTNPYLSRSCGATTEESLQWSDVMSLTAGDWLKPAAYQNASASEAYYTGATRGCGISIEYIGPA